jgi:magnesium transporter
MMRGNSNEEPWLVVDGTGEAHLLESGEHEIMRRTGLTATDLQILYNPSTILGRERAIIVSMEHIKAIITAYEVFLRDPSSTFVEELQARILRYDAATTPLPFEFATLEACLEAVFRVLKNGTKTLEQEARPALDELDSNISGNSLVVVGELKIRLDDITARVQKVNDELDHLFLDANLDEIYLTKKQQMEENSSTTTTAATGELELDMLEAYVDQINYTLRKLSTVSSLFHFSLFYS